MSLVVHGVDGWTNADEPAHALRWIQHPPTHPHPVLATLDQNGLIGTRNMPPTGSNPRARNLGTSVASTATNEPVSAPSAQHAQLTELRAQLRVYQTKQLELMEELVTVRSAFAAQSTKIEGQGELIDHLKEQLAGAQLVAHTTPAPPPQPVEVYAAERAPTWPASRRVQYARAPLEITGGASTKRGHPEQSGHRGGRGPPNKKVARDETWDLGDFDAVPFFKKWCITDLETLAAQIGDSSLSNARESVSSTPRAQAAQLKSLAGAFVELLWFPHQTAYTAGNIAQLFAFFLNTNHGDQATNDDSKPFYDHNHRICAWYWPKTVTDRAAYKSTHNAYQGRQGRLRMQAVRAVHQLYVSKEPELALVAIAESSSVDDDASSVVSLNSSAAKPRPKCTRKVHTSSIKRVDSTPFYTHQPSSGEEDSEREEDSEEEEDFDEEEEGGGSSSESSSSSSSEEEDDGGEPPRQAAEGVCPRDMPTLAAQYAALS